VIRADASGSAWPPGRRPGRQSDRGGRGAGHYLHRLTVVPDNQGARTGHGHRGRPVTASSSRTAITPWPDGLATETGATTTTGPELKRRPDHYPLFGFGNEIQGVYPEQDEDGQVRLFTYVIRE